MKDTSIPLDIVFINEVSLDDYEYTDDASEYENILDEEEIKAIDERYLEFIEEV